MDFETNPKLSALLTLALAVFTFHYLWNSENSAADPAEYNAILGSWKSAQGEPGNSLKFYLVPVDLPRSCFGITLFDGHAHFEKNFGADQLDARWNYGSHRPVELNIVFADRSCTAAIKVIDHDHLLLRLVEAEPHDSRAAGFFEHPDTLHLVRTAEADAH